MTVTPMHRGRWCEQHERWECVKPRKAGRGLCHGSPVTGSDRCRMHLGEQSAPAIAAARLEREAERVLYKHDAAPVTNPLEALQSLAGRALALERVIGEKVNDLRSIRYGTEGGGEQLRAEVAMLERAMDRLARILVDIAKLNIEDRLAGVREKTALMLEDALAAALQKSGAGLEQQAVAREEFHRRLRVVA